MKTTEDYNKTTKEIFTEFAEDTGRKIEYSEFAYPSNALHLAVYHIRKLCIPNNNEETSYYVAFQDHKKIGEQGLYCGVFIPVSLPISLNINIKERNIFHKLNPSLKKKTISIGLKRFDSKVVITGNDSNTVRSIFSDSRVQKLVLETLKLKAPLNITVNEPKFDFVPGLKGKSRFGIYNKHEWFMEASQIEPLFKLIEAFREVLKK